MSRWIRSKLPEFVRDLFRNFCQASLALEEQFRLFDKDGSVDFAVLKNLVGDEMNKGLLWRMKDTAHHVFRNDPDNPPAGQFLDWAMGYIFHETFKLKEDAYQKQNYAPWFHELFGADLAPSEKDISDQLGRILAQTEESMFREIERIRFIIAQCRQLLPYYLTRHRDNPLLARFIYARNNMVRSVFNSDYKMLIEAVYSGEPERMYVLASRSLREGGWKDEAQNAIHEALRLEPQSKLVLQEKKIIDNWAPRIDI